MIAYDLNEPEVVSRLKKLGKRLRIIVDDSDAHGEPGSAETKAAGELADAAGEDNVRRQHVLNLQHNKVFVVDGPKGKTVACGSTNFSWRGFNVQNNNALVLRDATAPAAYHAAFEAYWHGSPKAFGDTASANWTDIGLQGIDARVAFSPHSASNALLATIADDLDKQTTSSLLFSLAFLYQTPGPVSARVYLGSYNFSSPADTKNGENLLRIRDRRIAVSFMVEAVRICDHYDFRVTQSASKKAGKPFVLRKPPREPGDVPWWKRYYTDVHRIRDRELFA